MIQRRAFTLIELLIVVAIVGIFAAIASPRYGDAMDRYRADAAARRIAADFNLAQARARSTGSSRSVVFDAERSSYAIPSERHLDSASTTYFVDLAAHPYRVSVGTVNFGSVATVTFNGYGVPDNAGSVQIRSGAVVRTISIDADSGATKIQ